MKDEKIKNDSSLVRKKEIDAGPRFVTRFFGISTFNVGPIYISVSVRKCRRKGKFGNVFILLDDV
jgi:hypothetical protein